MDEVAEERKRLYQQCRDDLLKRQLSNSENFDKSILSLSMAGLGFSLAFIRNVVPLSHADYFIILYASWISFAAAIVSTLVSFVTSQEGVDRQLEYARQYYLENKTDFLSKTNCWAKVTKRLNFLSASVFIIAIILTILFVSLNTL